MSNAEKKDESAKAPSYRIPASSRWASAWKISAVLGAVGLAAALFGMTSEPRRFAFSWLFAFMTFLAVGLGALFFVLGQHLTGAGWGVTVRRTSELLLSGLPVFALLFVPIALNLEHLYPWMRVASHEERAEPEHGEPAHGDPHGALGLASGRALAQERRALHDVVPSEWGTGGTEPAPADQHTPQHAEHEHVLREKIDFFHLGGKGVFFLIRAMIYFIAWIVLSMLFVGWSTKQDTEHGHVLTKKLQRLAPPATFVFGLTLSFAAVDWMMTLEPSWYSTIFGVLYFAVSAVIGHAAIVLLALAIRRAKLTGDAINPEHFHDLGKLLFGFIVFWAYISFSQMMLIWYAGIPEEQTYYHLRWWGGGGFREISMIVLIGGFVVPFFLLISRNTKRRLSMLGLSAAWVLVMHVVQMYWLVMPYAEQTSLVHTFVRVHWIDVAALVAVGGIYLAVVLWQMTRFPLVPVGDPRLPRALAFENA